MNSMEYEIDSMGGLMPQILALTAPPGTRDTNRQPQVQPGAPSSAMNQAGVNGSAQPSKPLEAGLAAHPYFKRPGRGHNHDSCDACGEGGDLICCDLCPASFHLTCRDPPLDEDEIPVGEWACHQCRMGGNDDCASNSSGRSCKSTKVTSKKKEKEENDRKVFAGGREFEISDTPLATLIKAAAIVNPKQFMLPFEFTMPANFPGEPKESKKNGSRRGFSKKKPYELDNGLVPLPAKLCFQCSKSCRMGPLIPCDYCPLFFHLDCLDPPLTVPPMGRWMCPNHPEHIMDTNILTSHSLTERVRLWDKFVPPVDQNSVKLRFLQRCHRMNPPFRFKVKKVLRSRIRVPASIKAHYRDPPDLMPHLSPSHYLALPPPVGPICSDSSSKVKATAAPPPNPLAASATLNATTAASLPGSDCRNDTTTITTAPPDCANIKQEEVEEERGKGEGGETTPQIVNVEADLTPRSADEAKPPQEQMEQESDEVESMDVDTPLPTKDEKEQWLASLLSLQSSIIKHLASNNSPTTLDKSSHSRPEPPSQMPIVDSRPSCLNGDVISHESRMNKMCIDGKKTSNSLVGGQSSLYYSGSKKGILKAQKGKISSVPILKSSHPKKLTSSQVLMSTLSSLSLSLKEKIEEKHDICLSTLDRTVVDILAYERLEQIMSPPKSEVVVSNPLLPARALLCPLSPDIRLKDMAPKKKFCTQPIPMMFRILTIGKGSHNQVNLEEFGQCNYISSHHASIIFDECTGYYELLNYSEHATKVDGISYFCDFTEKTISQAAPPPFLQQVKAIIAQRRGVRPYDRIPSPPPAMNSRPGEDMVRCKCRKRLERSCTINCTGSFSSASSALNPSNNMNDLEASSGWEGAAVLHHGSYIKFGCLQFVFSIVEEASKGDWAEETKATYEKFIRKEEEEKEAQRREEEEKEKEAKEKEAKEKEKKAKKEEKNCSKS